MEQEDEKISSKLGANLGVNTINNSWFNLFKKKKKEAYIFYKI
jgi:hypothetical protein